MSHNKVNKLKVTFSMDKEIVDMLNELSKETMISKSKLVDKALRDLGEKYGKKLNANN